LAHKVGSAVEAAYRRSDMVERRHQLAEAWAKFLDGTQGEILVLPIRATAG
jgi:hypothetical protein